MIHTSKQLKDKVRNISHGDNQTAQMLIRNFIMERFLERVSLSRYRNTGEYDEVLPIDYSRTAQNILAEARPYTAENGEAYTFNFMHACEKVIPVTDGKISLGLLLQVYLFDAVGGGKDRVLWLYELEG